MPTSLKVLLRNLIKDSIRRAGFEILRSDRLPVAVNGQLDLACLALHGCKGPLTLVQIGANDGLIRDPARDVIVNLTAQAILVEPVPYTFAQLKKNYTGVPGIALEMAAIGKADSVLPIYVPRMGRGSMRIASFDQQHLIRHGISLSDIEVIEVPVLSVTSLLARQGWVAAPDVMQVDTEGNDWTIVQSVLDAGLRPAIINFENSHLGRTEKSESRCRLAAEGYRLFEPVNDTLAIAESVFSLNKN